MTGVVIFAFVTAVITLLLFWMSRNRTGTRQVPDEPKKMAVEELFPLHCRYFPQVRQALSADDRTYLKQRASATIVRKAHRERLAVTRQFLAGLQEDFSKLDHLGRTIAALSPEVSKRLEVERLWLTVRFHALYRMVWLRLALGSVAVPQLARLADLVGSLAAQTESAMTALGEESAKHLSSSFNA